MNNWVNCVMLVSSLPTVQLYKLYFGEIKMVCLLNNKYWVICYEK